MPSYTHATKDQPASNRSAALQAKPMEKLKQRKTSASAQLKGKEEKLKQKKALQLVKPEEELKQKKAVQFVKPEEELKQKKAMQPQQGNIQFKKPEKELLQHKAAPVQLQKNKTGMPDQLKSGIEHLSGQDMSDVKVHYNSSQPAQFQALAYAQGNQIHIGPGQERHLPHEAWHVVQQKQGRVQPTTQMKGSAINDSPSLEQEADTMGARAMQMKPANISDTNNPV